MCFEGSVVFQPIFSIFYLGSSFLRYGACGVVANETVMMEIIGAWFCIIFITYFSIIFPSFFLRVLDLRSVGKKVSK